MCGGHIIVCLYVFTVGLFEDNEQLGCGTVFIYHVLRVEPTGSFTGAVRSFGGAAGFDRLELAFRGGPRSGQGAQESLNQAWADGDGVVVTAATATTATGTSSIPTANTTKTTPIATTTTTTTTVVVSEHGGSIDNTTASLFH